MKQCVPDISVIIWAREESDLARFLELQFNGQPVLVAAVIKGILFLPTWKKGCPELPPERHRHP